MAKFEDLWQSLLLHGSSSYKRAAAEEEWNRYSTEQQQQIYDTICRKLEHNKFVHYDPVQAVRDNARKQSVKQMSFRDYYARYGTTEEKDGWRRIFLPELRKTIYEKN